MTLGTCIAGEHRAADRARGIAVFVVLWMSVWMSAGPAIALRPRIAPVNCGMIEQVRVIIARVLALLYLR